jgi:microcystin-dependent protein
MPSPTIPDNFKEVIADPANSVCTNFVRALLRLPVILYQLVKYAYTDTGYPSDLFRREANFLHPGDLISSLAPLNEYLDADSKAERLRCDGRTVSRTVYAELFAIIGTTFNTTGEAGTDFRLPDFTNRFPVAVGSDYALGATGGQKLVTLLDADMPSHTHSISGLSAVQMGDGSSGGVVLGAAGAYTASGNVDVSSAGSDSSHENRPPYMAVYVYIKT